MPEMSGPLAPDDASFTLPARPGVLLLEHPRVDLLAQEATRRRIPEGTRSGFAVLGSLVLFSCLVGGVTAGLVVIGVSTLLAASAALVTGHLSLVQVGGQRGASLLLGVGASALILGSVVSQQARPATELMAGTPVPASSPSAVAPPSPYAVTTPAPTRRAEPTVASASPTVAVEASEGAVPTLSPDALRPRPAEAEVVPATHDEKPARADKGNGDANGKGKGKGKGYANGKGNAKGKGAAKGAQKPKGAGENSGKAEPLTLVRDGLSAVRSVVADLL